MSFIYITGAPGSGKSTLQKELSARGLDVYDIDDPELGGAHNKDSGQRVTIPLAQDRRTDWYDKHEWRIDRIALSNLKKNSANTTIICGVAPDDGDILNLFDKVFYLRVDDINLKIRIAMRTDNDYGKNPHELADILKRKKILDSKYDNFRAFMVDAMLTPSDIADYVLAEIK
jgi:adenylate kinase family enzyme